LRSQINALMDTFKDLFQEVKDRIRNPFISSFAIAWLFFNWRITVSLVFYNDEILKRSGFNTFNNLINERQDNCKMLLFPFLSACIYVFGFPYIRNFINEFLANRKLDNENRILENSKKSSVKLERYIELLKELEQQQKIVGDIYSKQKSELEKLAVAQSNYAREQQITAELKNQINDTNKSAQNFKNNITIPNIINGSWEVIIDNVQDDAPQKWTISGDDIYFPNDNEGKIREFMYNPSIGIVHFSIFTELRTPAGPSSFYVEEVFSESYLMRMENETTFYDGRKGLIMKKMFDR